MITIILENKDNQIVAKCGKTGNELYLIRNESEFPKLSLLSEIDYDVLAELDMPELIDELEALRPRVSKENQFHIDEIIKLAIRCRDEDELTLIFTPFGQ